MINYEKGKIYKLIDNTNGNIYIGSTIQTLSKRKAGHKESFNRGKGTCVSKSIIENGNYDIILIEKYPCKSKEELFSRERYYIEKNNCINKYLPIRTKQEKKEYNKKNCQKFRNENKNYDKDYYKKNKERKKITDKKFYEKNKEKCKKYSKQRRIFVKSWGGDVRSENNLLKIDVKLFFFD